VLRSLPLLKNGSKPIIIFNNRSFFTKVEKDNNNGHLAPSNIRRNKVMLQSLGCPRNWVDSEVMLGIMLQAGYEITQDVSDADY